MLTTGTYLKATMASTLSDAEWLYTTSIDTPPIAWLSGSYIFITRTSFSGSLLTVNNSFILILPIKYGGRK